MKSYNGCIYTEIWYNVNEIGHKKPLMSLILKDIYECSEWIARIFILFGARQHHTHSQLLYIVYFCFKVEKIYIGHATTWWQHFPFWVNFYFDTTYRHTHTHNEDLLMNYWCESNLFFCLLPDMEAWGTIYNFCFIKISWWRLVQTRAWWLCVFDRREVDASTEFWSVFRRDGAVWRKRSEPNHLHRNQTSHGSHQQHAGGLHLHHR